MSFLRSKEEKVISVDDVVIAPLLKFSSLLSFPPIFSESSKNFTLYYKITLICICLYIIYFVMASHQLL